MNAKYYILQKKHPVFYEIYYFCWVRQVRAFYFFFLYQILDCANADVTTVIRNVDFTLLTK
jgi:hypothetical protein